MKQETSIEEIAERIAANHFSAQLEPQQFKRLRHDTIEALRNEREACARICDDAESPDYDYWLMESGWEDCKIYLAAAIRKGDR